MFTHEHWSWKNPGKSAGTMADTNIPESVTPAGLRMRAQIMRWRSDESTARHLELAATEIERLCMLLPGRLVPHHGSGGGTLPDADGGGQ